jgi:cysteine synthase
VDGQTGLERLVDLATIQAVVTRAAALEVVGDVLRRLAKGEVDAPLGLGLVDLVRELVDEWALVDEEAIRDALRMVIDTEHQLVEGSAAAAFAAARARRADIAGKRVAVISCGRNISAATLATALAG